MDVDLVADLNAEDDESLNWTLLSDAREPGSVRPGSVMRAGQGRFWAWVLIDRVDPDGQVHFRQLSAGEARRLIAAS